MSISSRVGKLIEIESYSGILHSNENEKNTHIGNGEESQSHNRYWVKINTKEYVLWELIWNLRTDKTMVMSKWQQRKISCRVELSGTDVIRLCLVFFSD